MIIALTGHTAGIGLAFSKILKSRGHDIIGISRREGTNIRRVAHIVTMIEHCDLFINNAQEMYVQTELLYAVWKKWQGKEGKYIWNISTQMVEEPINSRPDGQDDIIMSQYRNQKIALEKASKQLRFKNSWPRISIIRPGGVATQEKFDNTEKYAPDVWVKSIIDTFSHNDNISINEISIGYTKNRIPI